MERSADGRIHTTEWEDVQYKFGNRVGKYATRELQILAQRLADQNQNASLQPYNADDERAERRRERQDREDRTELQSSPESKSGDEMHDDEGDDDELLQLRQRRLRALQAVQQRHRFGLLRSVEGDQYVAEVTDASVEAWVVAVLVKPGEGASETLLNVLRAVAQRHRDVKFVSLVASDVVANFPEKHLPCVLLYKDRTLKQQISGLEAWRRRRELTAQTVEAVLREHGVVPQDEDV